MYFQTRRYGLTQDQHEAVTASGKCNLCGSDGSDSAKGLVIDHCHQTNVIRGLLCFSCNFLVGWLENSDWEHLKTVHAYVEGEHMNIEPAAPIRVGFDIRNQ